MTMLREQFRSAFVEDAPLAPLTTFKVGGPAKGLLTVRDTGELQKALAILERFNVPYLLMGRGANLIVPDEGFKGLVIRLKEKFEMIRPIKKTRGTLYLHVGAGVSLPSLLAYTTRHGLSGLEPLVAIPGTVGGALIMNAGIPGFSISEALSSITSLKSPQTLIKRYRRQLHPSYRDMGLPAGEIVLHATFKLKPSTEREVRKRVHHFLEKRRNQTWRKYPTAGSVFKNPEGASAGKLIESCGLKGYQIGDAQISPVHANVIVNRGKATAKDIFDLITHVQKEVAKKTGIYLEPEVIIARN